MRALFIAEKPSVASTVKEVYEKIKGSLPYEIDFLAQRGHLITLKYPEELSEDLKEWTWETLPIEPEKFGGFKYKIIEEKSDGKHMTAKERFTKIGDALKSGHYDFVINGGDTDQEGELLVRIVLDQLRNKLPVKRFWVDDLTEKLIADGLRNLRDDDSEPALVNLFSAAIARQHSDYRVGMNLTRAATLKFGRRVAVGRVKTPILAMVCKREDDIENFVPHTKYGIEAVYNGDFSGVMFNPTADKDGSEEDEDDKDEKDESKKGVIWFDDKADADCLIAKLSKEATVESLSKKRQETLPPKLFTLATLQEAAGKFGISAEETLNTVQALYERKFMSYPRTDCEYVASSEDFTGILGALNKTTEFGPVIKTITKSDFERTTHTKKWVNDAALKSHESGHTALRPTTLVPEISKLTTNEKIVYNLVAKRFIAIFLKPLVQDKTVIVADIDGNKFRSNGKITIDKGYTEFLGISLSDAELPEVSDGAVLNVNEYRCKEKTSVCPKRYSDGELIMACEKPAKYLEDESLKKLGKELSIGTSATRAGIIEQLIRVDEYLERVKEGKIERIAPTATGRAIIKNLSGLGICRVDMTGQWEILLKKVRGGTLELAALEDEMRNEVVKQINEIKDIVAKVIIPLTSSEVKKGGKAPICTCPACGKGIMEGEKSFYCPGYKDTPACHHSIFKTSGAVKINATNAVKLFKGETVEVDASKKDDSGKTVTWKQKVRYDVSTDHLEFVKTEKTESGDASKPSASSISSIPCPECKSLMKDKGSLYVCDCGVILWRNCFGNTLREATLKELVEKGRVKNVHGFVSRRGTCYDADIILEKKVKDGKTQYSGVCDFSK